MPENHQYRHGLAVMRAQPLHIGHEKVIRDMLAKCGKVTIILGSIQEQGTARNPFSYTERKQMIKKRVQCRNRKQKAAGYRSV